MQNIAHLSHKCKLERFRRLTRRVLHVVCTLGQSELLHMQGAKCADKAWPQSQGGACKSGLKCYKISCAYWQCDTHQPPKEPKGERESVSRRRGLPAVGIAHHAANCASYP